MSQIHPFIVALHDPNSFAGEKYRTVYANLACNSSRFHTLAVTSAVPSEGRSVNLVNLAVTTARESGKRVLLVDCDHIRPTLHEYLGLANPSGVWDVLINRVDFHDAILVTSVKNLYLLPAGRVPPSLAGVITSPAMKDLIQKLKSEFDYVLFDSPSMGQSSDAGLLGKQLDGVVFLVRSESTQREVAETAKNRLQSLEVKILGCIFVRHRFHIPSRIYELIR